MIEDKDRRRISFTFFLVLICLVISGLAAVIGAFYLFFAPFDAQNFIITGAILLTFLLSFIVVALLKCLVVFIHKLCKAEKSTQIRNEILIGLGGIVFCTNLPRILVFFVDPVSWFDLSIPLSCVISIALYFIFVFECDENYEWNKPGKLKPWLIFAACYFIVLMITIKIAITYYKNNAVFAYQMLTLYFAIWPTIDFYALLSGQRRLELQDQKEERAKKVENVRLESVKVVPKAEETPRFERGTYESQKPQAAQTHPKIDCKICYLEYSEARIPRILNGCGHTICEKCAETLLEKNEGKFLLCPFCQELTAVKGPASTLHKSYAVLEIINDLKD